MMSYRDTQCKRKREIAIHTVVLALKRYKSNKSLLHMHAYAVFIYDSMQVTSNGLDSKRNGELLPLHLMNGKSGILVSLILMMRTSFEHRYMVHSFRIARL